MPRVSLPLMSVPRTRVSPYPLRSNRTKKEKEPEVADSSKWEDVKCVICMDTPHNAVLLQCENSFGRCRPYMCNPSALHSSCFKEFRRTNKIKKHSSLIKTLDCPLCRGVVHETTKVSSDGRRCMNAIPKPCPVDDCRFSGTYAQLEKHMKNDHHGQNLDLEREWSWERMSRIAEYTEIVNALENFHGSMQERIEASNRVGSSNMATTRIPMMQYNSVSIFDAWFPLP